LKKIFLIIQFKGELKMIRTALQIIGGLTVAAIGATAIVAAQPETTEIKELKQATDFFRSIEFKIKPQRKVEEEC
jgi:hypothetical protein